MKNEHRKVMKLWKVTDHHHHESELQGSQDCSSMHLNSGSSSCTQTILNDPDLADTRRPFQQDCPPSIAAVVNNFT